MREKNRAGKTVLSILLAAAAILWLYPIFMILINSVKKESAISTALALSLIHI